MDSLLLAEDLAGELGADMILGGYRLSCVVGCVVCACNP